MQGHFFGLKLYCTSQYAGKGLQPCIKGQISELEFYFTLNRDWFRFIFECIIKENLIEFPFTRIQFLTESVGNMNFLDVKNSYFIFINWHTHKITLVENGKLAIARIDTLKNKFYGKNSMAFQKNILKFNQSKRNFLYFSVSCSKDR